MQVIPAVLAAAEAFFLSQAALARLMKDLAAALAEILTQFKTQAEAAVRAALAAQAQLTQALLLAQAARVCQIVLILPHAVVAVVAARIMELPEPRVAAAAQGRQAATAPQDR
jgi:hypothetical protein